MYVAAFPQVIAEQPGQRRSGLGVRILKEDLSKGATMSWFVRTWRHHDETLAEGFKIVLSHIVNKVKCFIRTHMDREATVLSVWRGLNYMNLLKSYLGENKL